MLWPDFWARYCAALREPVDGTVAAFAEHEYAYSELAEQRVQLNAKCVHALLCEDDRVGVERLGEVLDWFGPAERPEYAQPNAMLFDRIRIALSQPYNFISPCSFPSYGLAGSMDTSLSVPPVSVSPASLRAPSSSALVQSGAFLRSRRCVRTEGSRTAALSAV